MVHTLKKKDKKERQGHKRFGVCVQMYMILCTCVCACVYTHMCMYSEKKRLYRERIYFKVVFYWEKSAVTERGLQLLFI